jgi:hypothetical protein
MLKKMIVAAFPRLAHRMRRRRSSSSMTGPRNNIAALHAVQATTLTLSTHE